MDFIVVVVSIASLASARIDASFIVIARIFRVAVKLVQVLRLSSVPSLQRAQEMLDLVLKALPSTLSIGALLLLLIAVYALVGCKLFWAVPDDGTINSHANFRSFSNAVMLLIRCAAVCPSPPSAPLPGRCCMYACICAGVCLCLCVRQSA